MLLKLSPPVPVASPLKLSCMTRVAVALLSGPRGSGVECSLPHGWMPPSDVPLTELLSGGQRPGSGVTEGEQWERVSLIPATEQLPGRIWRGRGDLRAGDRPACVVTVSEQERGGVQD